MAESRGIIMFNRGEKCLCRAIVCLYTIRKFWSGPITFYLEDPYPHEFDEVCKYFYVDIVHNKENHDLKALVRKTDMFANPPYDRTLWIDADMLLLGPIDEMFDLLDDADCAIPHFARWWSDGPKMKARINRFKKIAEDRHIEKSLQHMPATNTGILSFRKSPQWTKFVKDWVTLAHKGSQAKIFIPDEVAFQILYPSAEEWGLKIKIADPKYNVSVLHDPGTKDWRVMHYHGQKHVLEHKNCDLWKETFAEMCEKNIANINHYLQYADKRLKKYLQVKSGIDSDVTIVTACDEYYVDILRHTFPNWQKYKKIDKYPVIVFVHGMDVDTDERLDFLRLPNVKMIPWSKEKDLDGVTDHREEMLSAFVFGAARYVTTDYWMKLDADSFATDDRPFITEKMKQYAFCGHRWGYSRPQHIQDLDKWAKSHWKRKLRRAKPMMQEGKVQSPKRFYHKTKRTISFIQLHRTKFTRFCVKLLKTRRLPAPTQDTFMFYVANRFDPETVGVMNFKKHFGFTQGRGKMGAEHIKSKLREVEAKNKK